MCIRFSVVAELCLLSYPRFQTSSGSLSSRDKKVIKKDGGCQEGEYQEHFELVRQAQYEYWSYEIYGRICFLYGMISFLQAFGYWMVIHCISELLLIWSGYVVGAAMCAAQWLIFRLDVLP